MFKKPKRKQAPPLLKKYPIYKKKVVKKIAKAIIFAFKCGWNCKAKKVEQPISPSLQGTFQRLYNEQEAAKKKPKHNFGITTHAMVRFQERFQSHGYSLDELRADITGGWKIIRAVNNGNFLVKGRLGKYIVSRDFSIVTMFPYGKKV